MKTGYLTYWVPEKGADLAKLKAQHNRTFPGNQLAIVEGMVKVAVMNGETPPKGATTAKPLPKAAITGNAPL